MPVHTESASVAKPLYSGGKQLAQHIFLETMAAIDVRHAMLAKLKREGETLIAGDIRFPLAQTPRVVAVGKAAKRMAAILHEILEGRIAAGLCVAPSAPQKPLPNFHYVTGGHPYPDHGSMEGARAALEFVRGLTAQEAVVFLISGGGSALFELPEDDAVTEADLAEFNRLLVTSALPIEEINVLRKHTSRVKGGRLAVAAHPAHQLTIYISDVPDQFASMVASGPTMPDESTAEQAYSIAESHALVAKFPAPIRRRFEQHLLVETPKPGDSRFANSQYFCLLSNHDALQAAKSTAEKLGFQCALASDPGEGDFRAVADANLAELDALAKQCPGQSLCLVAGGEVICPVTGGGIGGRNQAFTLYAAQKIAGSSRVVLSAGTDGRDGNSPSCGAVADGQTILRARALGKDPERFLADSDSYTFFRSLGDTLDTGYTDNNVRDVRLFLSFG